ncbi:MAG: NAD(+) synthase [Clostridia bacterium]|nr:NAD(+) synthase [Clostridia bacterium]
MVEALGKENILGVWMPCHSKEQDKQDAKLVSDYYGFELIDYDLTDTYETFKSNLDGLGQFNQEQTKNSDINVKPRLRMMTLYYLAALQSALKGKTYLVVGTSNKCELFVGYFTKGRRFSSRYSSYCRLYSRRSYKDRRISKCST